MRYIPNEKDERNGFEIKILLFYRSQGDERPRKAVCSCSVAPGHRSTCEKSVVYYGAGGALGFDTLAAQTVLEMKKEYPQLRLILVLPCEDQTRNWRSEDIATYEDIKAGCDKVVYVSRRYTPDCMYKRNRHLVDHSGTCICYLTGESGGTAYTVRYARKKGVCVINLRV